MLFFICIGCKNVTEKETEQIQIAVDSTGLQIKMVEKETADLNLTSFLDNPVDLQEFKKKKGSNVTTTVTNGMKYHLHPKINDSIFYSYNFITENIGPKGINEIVVFKYGENRHTYEDETEILIELRIFNEDADLGKANLVGLARKELEAEFGSDYRILNNRMMYSNKNKLVILELDDSKVISYKYLKLATENVDSDLIQQLME
ncbi:hypothetical protein WIW50_04820 [Flavobacteriaceae bacterium 3-367]